MIHIHNRKRKNAVWQEAFLHLTHLVTQELHKGRRVLLFLSGGSVVRLYETLGQVLRNGEIDPSHISFAQADERFQPVADNRQPFGDAQGKPFDTELAECAQGKQITDNKERFINTNINSETIGETGLWQVCERACMSYYIVSQEGTLENAAAQYNRTIEKLFRECDYKMAVLGIGEDGHTAGLITGYEKEWNVDRCVVGYNLGQEKSRDFSCQHKLRERITVTPKLLEKLDYALVVAMGERKKEAVQNALEKENLEDLNKYPSAIIQKIKEVDMFIDGYG